jgi:hypothetical protein
MKRRRDAAPSPETVWRIWESFRGGRTMSLADLARSIRGETGCSPATACRAVADALTQGVLKRCESQHRGDDRPEAKDLRYESIPDMSPNAASPRPFRYLTIPKNDRERVHIVRETVRCGKSQCRCARGLKHGPYFYLRYEFWDADAGITRYAREYVPERELARVRRWVRRHRAATTAHGWGQAGLRRRILGRRLTRS